MYNTKKEMINILKERGPYNVSTNGIQHYTRCPYCGDSRNLSHTHLSVRINLDDDFPMVFRCLRCSVSGIVNESFLEELGVSTSNEFRKNLKVNTRNSMKLSKLTNTDQEKYFVPVTQNSKYHYKLDYINERLGTEFTLKDTQEHKIILDLKDFMIANEIYKRDRDVLLQSDEMLRTLQEYYVGFLSANNNCITFRDITGKQRFRYYKTIINERNMNGDSFYYCNNSYPLLYTNDVHIHMAEGIFDILSIKENLIKHKENNYFFATCGFGGVVIMKYVIHHALNTGIHFHIYSDNDKSDWEHKRYLRSGNLAEWMDHIYIHRNMHGGEKDYGIRKEKIKDTMIVLK